MKTTTRRLVKAGYTTVYIHTFEKGITRYTVKSAKRGVICRHVLFNDLPYYIREAVAYARLHQTRGN